MKHTSDTNVDKLPDLLTPSPEHKEREDDDCGLPQSPIFSDFSKYLWKNHPRLGRIQSAERTRINAEKIKNN